MHAHGDGSANTAATRCNAPAYLMTASLILNGAELAEATTDTTAQVTDTETEGMGSRRAPAPEL